MSSSFLQNIGAPGVQQNYFQVAPPKSPAAPKSKSKAPVSTGWQAAHDAMVRAKDTRGQVQAGPGPRVADDGQFRGPAYPGAGSAQNMSLYDWQQATGVYDAPVDSKNDTWTPTGFGVPGVPRNLESGFGLTDAYGRGVYGKDGKVQAPTGGRSNQKTTVNENGVKQTLTNTGAINMPGLEDADLSGIANFNGPSFPTQEGTNRITDGYANTSGVSGTDQAILYAQGRGGLDDLKGGATSDEAILHAQANGSLDGFKQGGKFAGAPTATEGQTEKRAYRPADPSGEGIGSRESDDDGWGDQAPQAYAASGEEMRRRAAFLDSSGDSLKAMDNVAKGMGMGRGFANVDGKAVAQSQEVRRGVLQAAPGEAQALKDKWVKALSANQSEEPQLASSAQNPNEESGTSSFITNPNVSVPGASADADYRANNQEDDLSIGNKVELDEDNFGKGGFASGQFDATKFYVK